MSTFEKRLRYGHTAETLVAEYLTENGYTVYGTKFDVPEPVDIVAFDGYSVSFVEVKRKEKLKFRNAMGIPLPQFAKYLTLQKTNNIPLSLFFWETKDNVLYTASIDTLLTEFKDSEGYTYPDYDFLKGEHVCVSIESMEKVKDIKETEPIVV